MAAIEDLIKQVADPGLREQLAAEVARLKATKRFGLVFEEHLPELLRLPSLPARGGTRVLKKDEHGSMAYRVISTINGQKLKIVPEAGGSEEIVARESVVVAKAFGEPMYPALVPVDAVERAPGKPWHILINADNYHALQLLLYGYEGKVDVTYIDPPYNSGARDWKYNNNYVDDADLSRHSKWLAMMKRRLLLAKRLLNPENSVLVVTIDEKEYLRLGMLLEQIFFGCNIQMVSTLTNPASVARAGSFGRSDEYVFFVLIGAASPQRVRLHRDWVSARGRTHTGNIRWDLLRRSGPNAARIDRPGLFYSIYVDPSGPRIGEIGDPLALNVHKAQPRLGLVAVLPIRKDGSEGNWQLKPATLRARLDQGRVRVTGSEEKGFTISVLKNGEYQKIKAGEYSVTGNRADGSIIVADSETDDVLAVPSTQWRISSHDATQYGSRLLADVLPGRDFPFPKSLYAVEDAIRFFVQNKPLAVVLDFFAGSGTTMHAVARLNKQDGGQRRSIMVTNNEVSATESAALRERGLQPGDPTWEALGICDNITWPRIRCVITGNTTQGTPIKGSYKFTDVFPMADGFDENAAYFKLDFLDPADVTRGEKFESIVPILWLLAGCRGICELSQGTGKWFIPKANPFAVLLKEDAFAEFLTKLAERPDSNYAFLVTDSTEAFREMAAELGRGYKSIQLYRSYIDTFRINLTEPGTITPGGVPAIPLSVAPFSPPAQEVTGAV
jgi:adenine-specific DNA-methyltransferase